MDIGFYDLDGQAVTTATHLADFAGVSSFHEHIEQGINYITIYLTRYPMQVNT